jgi:hypothetical protein
MVLQKYFDANILTNMNLTKRQCEIHSANIHIYIFVDILIIVNLKGALSWTGYPKKVPEWLLVAINHLKPVRFRKMSHKESDCQMIPIAIL